MLIEVSFPESFHKHIFRWTLGHRYLIHLPIEQNFREP
jgi:hypothetical protein